MLRNVSVVLLSILITALALYPVIVSLNRGVARLSHGLIRSNIELMEVLGSAIAKRDSDTNIHNYRVTLYSIRLAEAVAMDRASIRNLIAGAFLHDVGKIGISDSILLKPGKLTDDEFAVMKTHVTLGLDIIQKSSWLESAREVVEFHHEKYDGKGYMQGLKGEEIPLNARIFAIVDVFDALSSARPYKKPMSFDDAMGILEKDAGSHFDPALVATFRTIARPLHTKLTTADDGEIQSMLSTLVATYFLS